MFGLNGILAPISASDFLRDYYGIKAFYLEGEAEKFKDLFSWDDINHLLNTARPPNTVKLVYEKKPLLPSQLANLSHWLNEGATLIIDSLQAQDEFVFRFSEELARDINAAVNINCYTSCPNKQGFDMHFDTHDVFIVQVEGEKQWRVYEPTLIKTPLKSMNLVQNDCQPPDADSDVPYVDCILSEGDMLYIPKGHWHYAVAVNPSVHLTVGVDPTPGVHLLNWISNDLLNKNEFFRREIPIALAAEFGGPGGQQPLDEYVDEFKEQLRQLIQRDDFLDMIVHNCMLKNQTRRESALPLIWDLDKLVTAETKFSLLESQKSLIHYDPVEKKTLVYIRGSLLKLDEFPESLIRTLFANTGIFTGTTIIESSPEFSWAIVKQLLVKMYQSGIIINVNEDVE